MDVDSPEAQAIATSFINLSSDYALWEIHNHVELIEEAESIMADSVLDGVYYLGIEWKERVRLTKIIWLHKIEGYLKEI